MTDTSPDVERRYRELLLGRPGEARLRMGCSMHATARALVRASILARDPSASPAALRQALFLRFYGGEFDAATRERILERLGDERKRGGLVASPAAGCSATAGPSEGTIRARGTAQ